MFIRTLFAIAVLLLTFAPVSAEMYQWVEENGVVTFKDTPPPISKKRKKVKTYNDGDFAPTPPSQPEPAARSGRSAALPSSQAAHPKKERFTGTVEMFVTSWCGYCKQAQNYMASKGIPYVAYDIETDSAANRRHKELGGRGVPLIIIGSNKMSGFSPESLEYYLNNSR
ncbi:glutaredoxin domain-containing protein [Geobacter sp. AOG1]|uniref:glutaredoxin domain-containing protein n=1 Tax=Geobacter sp. AOG1 TaxID=1566346 RepID=UPI001CC67DD1|nr:glutaredoxin domain-containing protein [Geobacter sp. AOG1]GFE58516.1 NrdH-like redox domain-containing protein [Geobacter sp. AOG1]